MIKNQDFKKAACFTDLHIGLKHNSIQHNEDCVDFVKWFIEEAKARECETFIFLGDWHHHRNTINVSSLNYTMRCFDLLHDYFEKLFFIVGNHDLYYREKRTVHSIPMAKKYPKMIIIDEPLLLNDTAFVPWLVHDEWKEIVKLKHRYIFGHFELPGFLLNSQVKMPDNGGINRSYFKNQEFVFSGHFHKRQQWGNIHYIGNPFGHNFADSWDFNRGAMFLEWGGEPEYVNWPAGPKYINTSLSELTIRPDEILVENSYIRANIDIVLCYEDVMFLTNLLNENFPARELKFVHDPEISDYQDKKNVSNGELETVDEIVAHQLSTIDSDTYDTAMLIDIYNHL